MRVLDTNILIYYSRRETIVSEKVEQWLRIGPLLISTVVEAEVLAWSALDTVSLLELQQILRLFNVIPVDSAIAQTAATLARVYKTELLDAFIAATALHYQVPLVTRNVKDFAKIKEMNSTLRLAAGYQGECDAHRVGSADSFQNPFHPRRKRRDIHGVQ